MKQAMPLAIASTFLEKGIIPLCHTGRGEDKSPPFHLAGLHDRAQTIAIIMDDLDIPLIPAYTHWVIWNIPAIQTIPEGIPEGQEPAFPGGAVQGIGYGKHCYRGPKPPRFIRGPHRYRFCLYALDCALELAPTSKKKDLMAAMQGHILQQASITGLFSNRQM